MMLQHYDYLNTTDPDVLESLGLGLSVDDGWSADIIWSLITELVRKFDLLSSGDSYFHIFADELGVRADFSGWLTPDVEGGLFLDGAELTVSDDEGLAYPELAAFVQKAVIDELGLTVG